MLTRTSFIAQSKGFCDQAFLSILSSPTDVLVRCPINTEKEIFQIKMNLIFALKCLKKLALSIEFFSPSVFINGQKTSLVVNSDHLYASCFPFLTKLGCLLRRTVLTLKIEFA